MNFTTLIIPTEVEAVIYTLIGLAVGYFIKQIIELMKGSKNKQDEAINPNKDGSLCQVHSVQIASIQQQVSEFKDEIKEQYREFKSEILRQFEKLEKKIDNIK